MAASPAAMPAAATAAGTSAARVSVVISAYTEERWADLCAAVRSVAEQPVADVETIVVVDHNPALLARVARDLDGVRAVENVHPRGLSGARNSGIEATSGEILVFLDDDAAAQPGWLERLLAPYTAPGVVAVGGRIEPAWDTARPAWFPPEFDWVVGCTYEGVPPRQAPVRNMIGANMSFRREAFDAVGGFPDGIGRVGTVPVGCEETELCIRVRNRMPSREILYTPEAVVAHRVPDTRASVRYFLSRCLAEGRSKALVARIAGQGDALETERAYVTRILPLGVGRGLRDAARGDLGGLRRAAMIVAGVLTTAGGYALGRIRG
jgi:glycosyltransferase involved in cell wall biosynthesis